MASELHRILATVAAVMAAWPAYAQQPAAGGGQDVLIFVVVFFGVMYLVMIRPQMKKAKQHRQMVDDLRKGDEVITNGGLLGRVRDIGSSFLLVELTEGVEVKLQKTAITTVLPKGTIQHL